MKLLYRLLVYLMGKAFNTFLFDYLDTLASKVEQRLPEDYVDSVLFK